MQYPPTSSTNEGTSCNPKGNISRHKSTSTENTGLELSGANGARSGTPTEPTEIVQPNQTTNKPPVGDGVPNSPQGTPPSPKKRNLLDTFKDEEPSSKIRKVSPACTPAKDLKDCPTTPRFPSPPNEAATAFDKATWQGYCEIESEPAYFSVILREIGVEGITVREVPCCDAETLSVLPQPTFGLILLFRHRQFDVANQEESDSSKVWFANQMPGQNSCATLAMIHTLLNLSDTEAVDIGEHMRQFEDFSKELSPLQRGQAFASWQYVKKIHNSFAKKMDILQSDEFLASKVKKAARKKEEARIKKAKQAKSKSKSKSKSRKRKDGSPDSASTNGSAEDSEEHAHHYLAFVPINGTIWKLDGMEDQPTAMGTYDADCPETWLYAISERLLELMQAGDDDYGVYAVSQSPLVDLRSQTRTAENTLKHLERRLDAVSPEWKSLASENDSEPPSLSFLGSATSEHPRAALAVPQSIQAKMDSEDVPALLERRSALLMELRRLSVEYSVEQGLEGAENEQAEQRRWDYGPAIRKWLEMLAENGYLEENLHRFPQDG